MRELSAKQSNGALATEDANLRSGVLFKLKGVFRFVCAFVELAFHTRLLVRNCLCSPLLVSDVFILFMNLEFIDQ